VRTVLASSIRVGFDTLRANPLRTLLSTLGVIMGVASLISVLSLGDGFERFARAQIERTTDLQMISVSPRTTQIIDGQPFPRTDFPIFGASDGDSVRQLAGKSTLVMLQANGQALVMTRTTSTPRVAQVTGIDGDYVAIQAPHVVAGRHLTVTEMRNGAPVVVISNTLARDLAAPREMSAIIGDTVRLQGAPLVVVGIVGPNDGGSTLVPKAAYVPLTILPRVVVRQEAARAAVMLLKVPTVESVVPARTRLETWLASRYGTWKEKVAIGTHTGRVEQAQQGILIFKLLMGALTGISLIVGGIGIMNVLLASVVERTREIGIRNAAGAQQRHILTQFLAESVTISGAGSLIGIGLGVGAAFTVTAVMRSMSKAQIYAGFSLSTFLVGVFASVIVGLVFGLYPALRAAKLSPIEAIHHE